MRPLNATCRLGVLGAVALTLVITACGGVTQFSDKAALGIVGTPPPPPPPPTPPPPPPEPPKPMRVEMRDNSIEIKEKIQFAKNDSTILEVSFSLLDEIAAVINKAPHVKLIEIGGHASSEGSDKHNLKLSDARTKSVMEYLVSKGGVPKEKLSAKGYGETKPLVSPEQTEEDRERNRRVEFLIIEQDVTKKKVEVDPTTGKENVVESATETKKAAPVEEAPKAEEKKAP